MYYTGLIIFGVLFTLFHNIKIYQIISSLFVLKCVAYFFNVLICNYNYDRCKQKDVFHLIHFSLLTLNLL